jgi:hypothetical protein
MYEVKAFHCSFCKKYSTSKSRIKSHEKECFKNPETKSCATCEFFKDHPIETPFGMDMSEMECEVGVVFGESERRAVKYETQCSFWKLSFELDEMYGHEESED